MMEVVIDSVTINHFIRCPRKKRPETGSYTNLDNYVSSKELVIGMDADNALADEWMRTCREETIKLILIRWGDVGGIKIVQKGRIHYHIKEKLRQLGFTRKPIDILVLQIAMNLNDRIVVSNDSEFWNPCNKRSCGNSNAPVAKLCRDRLGVRICLPDDLIKELEN